jgi:phosphoserine aminotransferase
MSALVKRLPQNADALAFSREPAAKPGNWLVQLQRPERSVRRMRANFSGGPGALPESVLQQAAEAVLCLPEIGMPVLGISHRSDWFRDIVAKAEANFRKLLNVPAGYQVLFLQGGATLQFSMIPMTLLRGRSGAAEYLDTGYWSHKAIADGEREGEIRVLWSGEPFGYRNLPEKDEIHARENAAYFHYVSNETVQGLQFNYLPGVEEVPRICDMSSDFLSRPIDISRFSLVYAHAQKNLGPSGTTVTVVRDEVLDATPDGLPSMLDYRNHAAAHSIYNTPPVFSVYVVYLVSEWLVRDIGSLETMDKLNRAKAEVIYRAVDASGGFYKGRAERRNRSVMNAVFNLPSAELDQTFVAEAEAEGLAGLKGHRAIGGIRASLYNAVTLQDVEMLSEFMTAFCRRYG